MNILASLIQLTNKVLVLSNEGTIIKKFVAYSDNNPILEELEILSSDIQDESEMFQHPIESGASITDSRILTPNIVNINALISYDDSETLTDLENLYINATPLKIRAGNKVIDKAIISAKPNAIDSERWDKSAYDIVFSEYFEVSPVYVEMPKSANKSSVSRVHSGIKKSTNKPVKKNSWAYSAIFGGRT